MYLGNIGHANNPELLKAMGITQLLSVGEPVTWVRGQREKWGANKMLFIDRVQDNGVDPLTNEFERCLEFIGRAHLNPVPFYPLPRLIGLCRKRQSGWDGNASSLPSGRFPVGYYLYCRSDGVFGSIFSSCIVS